MMAKTSQPFMVAVVCTVWRGRLPVVGQRMLLGAAVLGKLGVAKSARMT